MRSLEERREEQRQFERDVSYEVWRSGGDPDRIDHDRTYDHFYEGYRPDESARVELRAQRPKSQEPELEDQQEEEP